MLAELFTWWTRQMAGLAAPLLRRLQAVEPDAFLLTPITGHPADLRAARRRKGRIDALDDIRDDAEPDALRRLVAAERGRSPVVIVLPKPPLIRDVTLPVAAEASLDRVLRYEMDRLTPFAVDDVFFTSRIVGHDRIRASLQVELALVPRTWVQPLLDRLSAAGVEPNALEAAGPDGVVRRIPIVHDDPARRARQRLAWRVGMGVCASLAIGTVAAPVIRQSLALNALADQIADLRPQVEQVEMLRQRIAAGSAGSGKIAAARQQAGEALTILGVLTDTLPDDTWLTSLTLRQRHLVLEGHSAAATRLITAMAGETRLRNPSFAAPVVRAETGGEVFTIQAEVAP